MIQRGTFVFPKTDRDFMQQLEMRGNNGGVETVETVYALAGSTYFVPETLIALDDPDLYKAAEPRRVQTDDWEVIRTIDEAYTPRSASGVKETEAGPRMLVRVHTHPTGRTRPSDNDREAAAHRDLLYRYFDDCEIFLGIHGLGEECAPDPEWMRVPERTAENEVSWWGENRKHKLAVFDREYEPRPVRLLSAADVQRQRQQRRQAGRQPRARPEPQSEPETGGEIWDA